MTTTQRSSGSTRGFDLTALALAAGASAAVGYGVNANGGLFNFDLANPGAPINPIGNLGFVPEGIDFRPGTNILYAIDVGAVNTQLYTVNTATGAATPVGSSFLTTSPTGAYNLANQRQFGFDFNPSTLQGDNSMRIRLVGAGGANLRLNDTTGQIAGVDSNLSYFNDEGFPQVTAAAYINSNVATAGGATQLFVMDFARDSLYIQNPPNAGDLNLVGAFGVTIDGLPGGSFDILTDPDSNDPTIGGDTGYAVFQRPTARGLNPWLLYNVNLANGQTTGGIFVGGQAFATDFTGGFAVVIPAPASAGLLALSGLAALRRRRTA